MVPDTVSTDTVSTIVPPAEGIIRTGADAIIHFGPQKFTKLADELLADFILLGAEHLPDSQEEGKKKGRNPSQEIYDYIRNLKAPSSGSSGGTSSHSSNSSVINSSTGRSSGGSGGRETISVAGTNVTRSKDPVGVYKGAPFYCWGKCI